MTLTPDKVADLRVKHLEMLQSVISRIAGYGASFKGLCITLTTAVCGFGITSHSSYVVVLAILPVFAFCVLDANCLRVERRFRLVYDSIRRQPWDTAPDFEISIVSAPPLHIWDVLKSWAISGFYGPLLAGVLIVAAVGRVLNVIK